MLKKIIAIKNVGRFRSSAAPGNPQLAKHTLILGANGYGKTTLCAVLRSLQSGDGTHVIGRKSLGGTHPPEIDLLFDDGNAQFKGQAWTRTVPELAIFDGTFVAQNIHSGDIVDLEHKRNLYRVIIGEEGVALAEEDARLAADGRAKTGEITAGGKVLQAHLPTGMPIKDFLKLPADPEIDTKITEQEKSLEAIRQANQIQTRSVLAEIVLPELVRAPGGAARQDPRRHRRGRRAAHRRPSYRP